MYKSNNFLIILLFASLVFFLNSCTSPNTDYIGENYFIDITSQNQLTQNTLTLGTKNFLMTNALYKEYNNSPERIIKHCFQALNQNENKLLLEHNYRHTLKVLIELSINEAKKENKIKYWMTACYLSYRYLYDTAILPPLSKMKTPGIETIEKYYNFSLYKIFNYLQNQHLLHDDSFEIKMISGSVKFNKAKSTLPWEIKTFKQFLICYNYKAKKFNETIFQLGSGLPLCGIPADTDRFHKVAKNIKVIKYLYPCNFILQFHNLKSENNQFNVTPVYLDFYKSIHTEINHNKILLSNNYTAAIGNFLKTYPEITEVTYFFNPGKMISSKKSGLYMLTPFDKNKIPVLLIHGLISDPQSMAQILNTLMQRNAIRENYQFWFYFYPTGQPVLFDSFILRNILNALYKKHNVQDSGKFNDMVVIGYSLGGLVAQLLIQDSNENNLKKSVFPLEYKDMNITQKRKKQLDKILNFKPLPYIKQVIFISTPHRGAKMASWVSSQLVGKLITSPEEYYTEYKNTLMFLSKYTRNYNDHIISGNALDNLSPKSQFIKNTQDLPYGKNVEIYSIIGDRNKAGKLGGSDGVVPYKSSHLNNAISETVIKSNHHSIYRPACAKEIFKILLKNLKSKGSDQ
jgi:triacylglycerol esterase/lipase EstA (alpha/beta hydrolase family)